MKLQHLPLLLLFLTSRSDSEESQDYYTVVTVSQSSVFTGDTVTLRCEVKDQWNKHINVDDWSFYWRKDSDYGVSGSSTKTLIKVKESDGGEYRCFATSDHYSTQYSDTVTLTVLDIFTVVTVSQSSVFTGDTVTLRCEVKERKNRHVNVDDWSFYWSKDSESYHEESPNKTLSRVRVSDGGEYRCRAASASVHHVSSLSDTVTLTVLDIFPRLTISQSSVFTGDTVTLRCEVKERKNRHVNVYRWSFYWSKDSDYGVSGSSTKTLNNVKVSDGGEYRCRAAHYSLEYSNTVTLTVLDLHPVVRSDPASSVFSGDSVTLRCEVDQTVDGLKFLWFKDSVPYHRQSSAIIFSPVGVSDGGDYRCAAGLGGSSSSFSETLTLTVQQLKAELRVSPGHWVKEGDTVTLICEINHSSSDWTFSWFRRELSSGGSSEVLLSNSSRGATGTYSISSAALHHTGVYSCRAEERKIKKSLSSVSKPLFISGASAAASVIISPNRSQHFSSASLSLSCESHTHTGWTLRRVTRHQTLDTCPSTRRLEAASTCIIESIRESDTGVYWCESESGEKSSPVNITVTSSDPQMSVWKLLSFLVALSSHLMATVVMIDTRRRIKHQADSSRVSQDERVIE